MLCPAANHVPMLYHTTVTRVCMRRLHSNGQHWVPILDAAVKWAPGVGIWDEGASRGLFVRNPTTGSSPPSGAGTPYLGQVSDRCLRSVTVCGEHHKTSQNAFQIDIGRCKYHSVLVSSHHPHPHHHTACAASHAAGAAE
jgi:hypothetical protein